MLLWRFFGGALATLPCLHNTEYFNFGSHTYSLCFWELENGHHSHGKKIKLKLADIKYASLVCLESPLVAWQPTLMSRLQDVTVNTEERAKPPLKSQHVIFMFWVLHRLISLEDEVRQKQLHWKNINIGIWYCSFHHTLGPRLKYILEVLAHTSTKAHRHRCEDLSVSPVRHNLSVCPGERSSDTGGEHSRHGRAQVVVLCK